MNENHYLDIRVCNGRTFDNSEGVALFLDEYELKETFFLMVSGELIVESTLLSKIRPLIENDCLIKKVSAIETRDDLEVSYKLKDQLEFWIIEPTSGKEFEHITFWEKKHVVVSRKLLDQLVINNGFRDSFLGSIYGKEYEVLTNRILISAEVDTYFKNQFRHDLDFIETMEKKARDRYRVVNGLPKLSS